MTTTKLETLYGPANENSEIAEKIKAQEPVDTGRRRQLEAEAKAKFEAARIAYAAEQGKLSAKYEIERIMANTTTIPFKESGNYDLKTVINELQAILDKIPSHLQQNAELAVYDDVHVQYDDPLHLAFVNKEQNESVRHLCAMAGHPDEPCACSRLPPL